MSDERFRGKIKKFFSDKGYGFIERRGHDDLFFHVSNFSGGEPEQGMEVEFSIGPGRKGDEAKEIEPVVDFSSTLPLYQSDDWPAKNKGNAGLWFDKFCNTWERQRQGEWKFPDSDERWNDAGKGAWLHHFHENSFGDADQLREFNSRREQLVEMRNGESKTLKTTSRFVTGMGREHPIENGFAWHPTLGTPFLAGSSIKGMVRHWASKWLAEDDAAERVFGSPNQGVGTVIFLDALPTRRVKLEADVMTPHYGPWYQDKDDVDGKKAWPADWHDPTPIPFLTVAAGASFRFDLLPRRDDEGHRDDVELALQWLTDALEWIGAGAKTAVGYGRFTSQQRT